MPSRLRYLFTFQPEAPYAHTGARALRRLRGLYQEAMMAPYSGGSLSDPVLTPFLPPAYPPTNLKGPELARWYFQHLPPSILKYCTLQIVREPRRCSYAASPANPRMRGWLPFNERKSEHKKVSHTYMYHVSPNKKQPPPEDPVSEILNETVSNWAIPPKASKKPPKPPAAAPTKKPSLKIGVWS